MMLATAEPGDVSGIGHNEVMVPFLVMLDAFAVLAVKRQSADCNGIIQIPPIRVRARLTQSHEKPQTRPLLAPRHANLKIANSRSLYPVLRDLVTGCVTGRCACSGVQLICAHNEDKGSGLGTPVSTR